MQDTRKLPRTFFQRNTLLVARALLGKYLVRRLSSGELLRGKIVETEAYAGLYDPGSHTYQDRRTELNQIWYGEGGFAYVYQIYGLYVCLGIITEPNGIPGAVLVRALEPTDGIDLLTMNGDTKKGARVKPALLCAGPSKLCIAMQIDKQCNGLDLCGDELYLEDSGEPYAIEEIVFTPRINIDYAETGALSAWRYYVRHSPAISKTSYEPLRDWRLKGYPSGHHLLHCCTEWKHRVAGERPEESLTGNGIKAHLHLWRHNTKDRWGGSPVHRGCAGYRGSIPTDS